MRPEIRDALLAFSQRHITRAEAIEQTGVGDYAGLLVLLGDAGMTFSMPSEEGADRQSADSDELWNAELQNMSGP
jgi:hypothetical protein